MTMTDRVETMKPVLRLARSRPANTVRPARGVSTHYRKTMHRQSIIATCAFLVVLVLTGLSLSHLTTGVQLITHSSWYLALSMAIGIDLGFVVMELAVITTVADKVRKVVEQHARPAIVVTLIGSAAMNAFSFANDADTLYLQIAGALLGCAIPGLIYKITRIAAAMYIDCHSKAQ